ncbi:MAG: hypothetical protein AAF151_20630, partial [Cyanobacteria bacterium J06656_5]
LTLPFKQEKHPIEAPDVSGFCRAYVKVHLLIHAFLKTDINPEGFSNSVKKQPTFCKPKQ